MLQPIPSEDLRPRKFYRVIVPSPFYTYSFSLFRERTWNNKLIPADRHDGNTPKVNLKDKTVYVIEVHKPTKTSANQVIVRVMVGEMFGWIYAGKDQKWIEVVSDPDG